jgi:outer membrane protein assembly factor BamB
VTAATSRQANLPNWPTYHRTNSRSGVARTTIQLPLHHKWTRRLDGAVYGEVLMVSGSLIAATENDSVYALNPANGRTRWRRHLGSAQSQSGLPCGNIDPLGITGTPAYDARSGSLFVVAETAGGHHTLWAINAKTGAKRWHRSLDVLPARNRSAEQERSALLVTHGRVITTFGGLDGDCSNYVGYVTSAPATGRGKITHYTVPTAREGGIWSPAGPVVGPNGNVYVASGNGAETGGHFDGSDSVLELRPRSLHRVALFAPRSWAADNAQDADLGSSSPVPVNRRFVIAGKRGTVYLLRQRLGGIGGNLAAVSGCNAFGGAAHVGHLALMPCLYSDQVRALHVGRHSLHWLWSAAGYASPVVAGHKVLVADLNSNRLEVLSLGTGHLLGSIGIGPLAAGGGHVFPSETVVGNSVYVGTMTGVSAVSGS